MSDRALRASTYGLGVIAATFFACVLFCGPATAQPIFPELTGPIVDNAGLIRAADLSAIHEDLTALEKASTDQLVVVTLKSLDGYDIADYGYQLGRKWGIGQKGKDNGVLLIVAPNERKVRIEVGRKLEPLLTDVMSNFIIQNGILPAFRRGDFSGGIRAGVRDIKDVLLGDAEAVKERARGGKPAPGADIVSLIFIAIWIAIILYVVYAQMQNARSMPQRAGRGRRRSSYDSGPVVVPGGSGGWNGDWSGSGSGGGWSGGGGDFGGGGASGSW